MGKKEVPESTEVLDSSAQMSDLEQLWETAEEPVAGVEQVTVAGESQDDVVEPEAEPKTEEKENIEVPETVEPKQETVEEPKEELPEAVETKVVEKTDEYVPNLNYKIGEEEFEFDDRLKAIVKDKESEDYVRDLVTKADGLDKSVARRELYKQELEGMRSTFDEVSQRNNELTDGITKFVNYAKGVKSGNVQDMDLILEELGLTSQDVFDYATAKLNAQEDPEAQRHYENSLKQRQNYYASEAQSHSVNSELNETMNMLLQTQTELEFSKPEVQEVANLIDQIHDKPGFFFDEYKSLGSSYFKSGKKVMPSQVVGELVTKFKPYINLYNKNSAGQTTAVNSEAPAKKEVPTMVDPSVTPIPDINGSAQATGKKVYKSMDEWDDVLESY